MPFVLYALGAGLMAWAGYLMVSGESYAAIDIAASLAGWGAFTIGLGAVTAALQRLTKAVGASRRAAASPADDTKAGRRERSEGKADGAAAKARPEERQRNRPRRADPAPPPEPIAPPAPLVAPPRTPEPAPAEAGADAGEAPPVKRDEASKAAGGEKRSMRAALRRPIRASDEPKVEAPPVAVSKLGGGLSLRRRRAEPPFAEEPQDEASAAPTPQPVTAPERLEPSPRPIMPIRAMPVAETPAEPAPVEEPVVGETHATDARSQDVAPPTPRVAEDVKPEADAAPVRTADEPQTPPAASGQAEAPAPESPPIPEPAANEPVAAEPAAAEPVAAAGPAPAGQPPVPEWLARARARREARLRTDTPRAPERPRFVREPEPTGETPPAPPRSPEPDPEPADAEPHPAPDVAEPDEPPVSPDPAPISSLEAERAEEPVPESADRRLVSEGEHNGVMYRFYDDGSVEAQSPHGVRRFASVDDLRRAVMNARGPGRLDADPGAAPEVVPEVLAPVETDPLDVALAELEGGARPAPKLHVDPEDRLGRL